MTKLIYTALLILGMLTASAQDMPQGPQMADTFRQEGKIYVVIAVLGIIFLALVAYLVLIDIRLKRLEQKNNLPS